MSDPFFHVWRVHLPTQTLRREAVPEAWEPLGGRALLARVMLDEVDAGCDPLGPDNLLIFAPGLLVGHMLSSCDRISIGAKSPLTGGIKESNAGGRTGLQLSHLGIKALLLQGQAPAGLWLMHLSASGARFESAEELAGMGVYEAAPRLLDRFGDKVAMALIGAGGEMQLLAAGIQNLDKDCVPSRIAARGGLGAVMGSKRLKAIVIDGKSGSKPPIADERRFRAARSTYNQNLMQHPQTNTYRDYGTAAMTMLCNTVGALPTRNFSSGEFEAAQQISGEALRDTMLTRGGGCDPSHACMAGCTIQSSNVFETAGGETVVSPLEYETIGLMGSNLGIDSFDAIARLNYEANDLGLDTIEIGAALGVAAEAGLLSFGDGDRALELIKQIRQGTDLGRVLGNGAAAVGDEFEVRRVPTVKRQALSAYDPRSVKGTGVTYATSPQGADHTCGLTIRANIDHLDPQGQAKVSRSAQYNMAGYDSLGACIFAGFGFSLDAEVIPALINARYGWNVGGDYLHSLGRECLTMEREFNRRAGFTAADDRLPKWMTEEPLPPHNAVFDVPTHEMDGIFDGD